ncbi:gp447 [Bacillus phage G]|uniref:Gp447 n=1 Tax=Bacillus phage G TaxID=2884420 RepID=G3MAI8_9CAUD|nr:gp447 [Bacillus phage G]AEO93705.1 gp447 [Bacillus phage G]
MKGNYWYEFVRENKFSIVVNDVVLGLLNNIIEFSDKSTITLNSVKDVFSKYELNIEKDNFKKSIFLFCINNNLVKASKYNAFTSDELSDAVDFMLERDINYYFEEIYQNSNEWQKNEKTIFCKDNVCPICNSNIEKISGKPVLVGHEYVSCIRECYSVMRPLSERGYIFLDVSIKFEGSGRFKSIGSTPREIANAIVTSINYWKENDRYLAELLKE